MRLAPACGQIPHSGRMRGGGAPARAAGRAPGRRDAEAAAGIASPACSRPAGGRPMRRSMWRVPASGIGSRLIRSGRGRRRAPGPDCDPPLRPLRRHLCRPAPHARPAGRGPSGTEPAAAGPCGSVCASAGRRALAPSCEPRQRRTCPRPPAALCTRACGRFAPWIGALPCAVCRRDLIGDGSGAESNLSEMAHMRGARAGSKRHDPNIGPDAVNKHTRLILLCPACHATVDGKDSKYTADMLEEIKSEFEARARKLVVRDLGVASLAELEVVAKWMATAPAAEPEGDYTVTAPLKKIRKNGLSPTAQTRIGTGMSKSHLVGRYVEAQPDPMFGGRLEEGFGAICQSLREKEGLDGEDALFRLLDTGADMPEVGDRTPAVLVVLAYLFEECEVFER